MDEPKPESCKHPRIVAWKDSATGESGELWSCAACNHRFVPISQLLTVESKLDAGNERFAKMVTGLTEEISARHELLRAIKADLDMRAKNGVVELSATIWNRLCVQLGES